MALCGLRVLEMAGLAPAPFCGMILADFGAKVIRVDRVNMTTVRALDKTPKKDAKLVLSLDTLARGKESIAVDLKKPEGVQLVKKLCTQSDVLIEPFRKGVMEKLGLGPDTLLAENPGLVYARLTGFGQKGSMSHKAGHDINYIAIAGVLAQLGRKHEKPYPPVNLVADFGGGGLTCAMGIMMALFEKSRSGQGQVVDSSMVNGSAYMSSFLWTSRKMPILWPGERGENRLDGGSAFYGTYRTKDDQYVSVGALEPQFYKDLIKGLNLTEEEMPQYTDNEVMEKRFEEIFLTKTRDEWTVVFKDLDACYAPVLDMHEAPKHKHNITDETFIYDDDGNVEPAPAPKLSRTPAVKKALPQPGVGEHTVSCLKGMGLSQGDIDKLLENRVVYQGDNASKL